MKSKRGSRAKGWAIVAATALSAGCGAPQAEVMLGAGESAIVGGTVTNARPEVGTFSRGCTVTLIAPRYALTAGSCTGFSSAVKPTDSVTFTDASGLRHTYSVTRMHSFGSGSGYGTPGLDEMTPDNFFPADGTNDVAILRLATSVPPAVAVPAQIASTPPRRGDRVTVFGYGCTNRETKTGGGTKEYFSWNFGDTTRVLCPGDTGGPVVFGNVGDGGQIWGTNTGYFANSGADLHGNVTYFKEQIVQLMRKWDSYSLDTGLDRNGGDYRDFTQRTDQPWECWEACAADPYCIAFTSLAADVQGAPAHCWLKNRITDAVPCPKCTSGSEFSEEPHTTRAGYDYSIFSLSEDRPELCRASCERDIHCAAYTYEPSWNGILGRCSLKTAAAAPSFGGSNISGHRRYLERGDRPGWDYKHFTVTPADTVVCMQACAKDPVCKAFTFVFPGVQGPDAVCWLKADVPAPSFATNMKSAVKRGLEVNTDRMGSDYRSFEPAFNVPEECQAACAAEDACLAWTFVPSHIQNYGARCWLKSGIPAATTSEGLVSGLKGAEFF